MNPQSTHLSSRRPSTLRWLSAFLICVAIFASPRLAQSSEPLPEPSITGPAKRTLANTFARLIEKAIPLEYDKKKDWGKTKNITVGIRNDGLKLSRRKKAVNHGVWKHYRVKLIDPAQNLGVRIEDLHVINGGRIGFTLVLTAKLDVWARAKVYQYGVHLVALEMVGDTNLELAFDCEVGAQLRTASGSPGLVIDPKVTEARLALSDFHLRRVSNARGPLVKELSSGLRRLVEHELKGPKLVAKINRSIDKRRDRLELNLSELLDSSWWPLASLPDMQRATRKSR